MRHRDTPELFGVGVGTGTCGDMRCGICGTLYNEGEDERAIYDRDSVLHTDFAGLDVCECCFEAIETEILRRIQNILPWYRGLLNAERRHLRAAEKQLRATETLQKEGSG